LSVLFYAEPDRCKYIDPSFHRNVRPGIFYLAIINGTSWAILVNIAEPAGWIPVVPFLNRVLKDFIYQSALYCTFIEGDELTCKEFAIKCINLHFLLNIWRNFIVLQKKSTMTHFQGLIKTIKERREILHVTQKNLAKISGVGLRTLKQFESGKGNPTLLTVKKLADVLGLEICLKVKEQLANETSEDII
jgi:DNA-binding XRE family transcriptional regulator